MKSVPPRMSKARWKWDRLKVKTLKEQRKRREQEPLWYCKLITTYPRLTFGITLGLHLCMVGLTGILFVTGYDILPIYLDDVPLSLHNEPWQGRVFALLDITNFPEHYVRIGSDADQTQTSPWANVEIYYESKEDSTVFTRDTFLKIKQLEDELMTVSGFESWCRIDIRMGSCTPPTSILRYFDGTYASIDPVFNDTEFDNINAVLYMAYTRPETALSFNFFLGKDYSIAKDKSFSPITRSILQFGLPLKEYNGDGFAYRQDVALWSHASMESVLEDFRKDNKNFIDVAYRSQALWYNFVIAQSIRDCFWVVGSVAFIGLVIIIHTRSLWIAGLSVLSVMTGFFITNLIYNIVFGFKYLGYFHILSLFIILGIGVDDFFVFYDIWRNSVVHNYPTLAHRLSDTYRKASTGMLFTSLTTALAFYVNAITPVLAVRSFGVFAGTAVVVNYLSVIIYFPTVVIMYHTNYENVPWPCLSCSETNNDNDFEADEISHRQISESISELKRKKYGKDKNYRDRIAKDLKVHHVPSACSHLGNGIKANGRYLPAIYQNGGPRQSRFITHYESYPVMSYGTIYNRGIFTDTYGIYNVKTSSSPLDSVAANRKKKPLMTRFFGGYYLSLVTNRYARWMILLLIVAVIVVFAHEVTTLEPSNTELQLLPDSHVYEIAKDHGLNSFVPSYGDETLQLYIVWGILEKDTSDCAFTAPVCKRVQVYDDTFDINPPENQQAMKTFCETLENMDDARAEKLRLRKNAFTGKYEIRCFLQSLENFLSAENTSGTDLRVPFTRDKVIQFMKDRSQFYNASLFDDGFKDYLQIPISYWLSQKYTYAVTDDLYTYDPLIGEGMHNYSVYVNGFADKYYGNFIKYVVVPVNTTIKFRQLGYDEGLPILDSWEKFIDEEKIVQNAIYGVIISLSVAFPLLIIATRNFIVGTLATFSLCCCTICTIGVIPLGGWKLGLLESLNMCMIVGLSVDFVMHLSQAYSRSLHTDRKARVKDMLEEIGTSVLFGAITSMGAAMFMFFTVITLLSQFATFMFTTIGFSLLFSLVMFTTLVGIIGPQSETGSLEALFRRNQKRPQDIKKRVSIKLPLKLNTL